MHIALNMYLINHSILLGINSLYEFMQIVKHDTPEIYL